MFVTSVPGIVVGVAPVPGTPIIVPPFVIPFPVGPPVAPFQSLTIGGL